MADVQHFISLRTRGDSILAAREDGSLVAVKDSWTPESIMQLKDIGDGKYGLMACANGKLLSMGPEGAAFRDEQPGEHTLKAVFTSCRPIALQSLSGEFLNYDEASQRFSPGQGSATLYKARLDPGLSEVTEAQNRTDTDKLRWNDISHRLFARLAWGMVSLYAEKSKNPEAEIITNFLNKPGAMERVYQGVHDADYVMPYDDEILGVAVYRNHFFHGKDHTNYQGDPSYTAYTECMKLFETFARDKDPYALGLSFHFFQDINQPMHAANYTNVLSDLTFNHSYYENAADDHLFRFAVGPEGFKSEDVPVYLHYGLSVLARHSAEEALNVHKNHVAPYLKWPYTYWDLPTMRPSLSVIVPDCQQRCALFLILAGQALAR